MSRPARTRRWIANLNEIVQDVLGCGPAGLVRTDAYRRLRQRLSRHPARFTPGPQAPPRSRDAPGAPPSWRGRKLVTPATDLVIDGFPGSANSFVAHAVRAAVDRPAQIESHFHHTVQLVRAVALGVPTVVIVRSPRDACRSLKSKSPALLDAIIAARWLRYHRVVLRYRHRPDFVALPFDDVIRDIDLVRRRSAGIARLVTRPLRADQALQRASPKHAAFGGGWLTERLMAINQRLYDALTADA